MLGREHATLRVTGSRCRCRCRCGVVQEFERVDGLIGEDLAVIANVDCQELRGLRAAVLAGVVVAALEAEVVGAAVVAELALAGELVALGTRGRRRAQRDGRGGRRSTPRRRSWLRSRCVELVLLDARQHRGPGDAGGGLEAHGRSELVLQPQKELGDEELGVDRQVEGEEVLHVLVEGAAVLCYTASLAKL